MIYFDLTELPCYNTATLFWTNIIIMTITHRIYNTIFRRIVSLCVIFLFVLDTGNFSPLISPTGAEEVSTLSPASRINPIVSIREEGGRLTLVEDKEQRGALLNGFKEDAAFLYLSTLLAQVVARFDSRISPEGIKALIEEHLSHVDFSRFLWKELYKEGDIYCLPYLREDDGRKQILKYHKVRQDADAFPEHVVMRFDDGVVAALTDPFQDDGAPENAGDSFVVLPALPKNPVIYEINARTYPKFGNITDAMLDEIKKKGADVVWLMGVWEESPFSEDLNRLFGRESRYRRVASAYAVMDYKVNPRLGGEMSLKDLVRRANARGIRVMLDMVPNHLAIDTPLAKERPGIFMEPSAEEIDELRKRPDFARKDEFEKIYRHPDTRRFFYYGRDGSHPTPYYDTLQLDISRPEARAFLRETIFKIAELTNGGGIRFDAVHLTFRQAIKDNWFPRMSREEFDRRYPPRDEFWKNVLSEVKQKYPGMVVISETFAGSGDIIHSLGFDYFYENFFRDKLQDGDMAALSRLFTGAIRNNYLKYLENHDINKRIVSVLGKEKAIAAAALLFTTPGAALIYQGQERGCSLWVPTAALVSGPADPGTAEVELHYDALGKIASLDVFRNGDFTLLDAHGGLMAFVRGHGGEKAVVIVNYSDRTENGMVTVDGESIQYSMAPWEYRILLKRDGHFDDRSERGAEVPGQARNKLLRERIRAIDEHYARGELAGRLTQCKIVDTHDAVFTPSDADEVAGIAAKFLASRKDPKILDLGGGNAKAACAFSLFGETTAVEIDRGLYEEGVGCVESLAVAGVISRDNIDLRCGDMWKESFSGYDLIYIYWPFLARVTPKMAEKLKKKLLAEAGPNTIFVINSVTEGVGERFNAGRIEYSGTVKAKGGISQITAYRIKGVHRGEGTRGLADGSPWFTCALLRQNFKGDAATVEQLVAQTAGRMPDGHLSAETVERDLATLVHLGLVEKTDNGGKAEFRAAEMSEDEWVTAEKTLIKLGSRPNAAEKQIAREELDAKLGLWKKGPSGQIFDEARVSGKAGEIYEKIKTLYYRRLIMSFYGDSSNVIFDPVEFASVFAEYCPAPTAEAKEIMSRVLAELRQEDFVEVFWGVFCRKRYFWQIRDTSGLKDKLRHVEIMAEMPQRRIPEIQLELIDYEMSNIPPQETGDLKAASNIVNGWIRDGVIIDNTPEDFIYNVRRLHSVVARSLLGAYYEGRDITPYRMGAVESAIRPKIYPKPFDVDFFMNNLAVRVCTKEFKAMHPVLQAAEVYQRLQDIQPFEDGNKRVSKLIMDYYLMRNHLPPLEISVGNRAEFVKTVRFMKSSEEFADFLADQLASQCVLLKLRGRVMSRLCSPEETREKHLIILPEKERLYKALLDEIRKAVSGADEPVILLSPDETMMRFFSSELPDAASLRPDDPEHIDISKCTLVLGAETLTTQEKYLEFSSEVLSKLPPRNTFKRIVYFNDRDVHPREAVENFKKELETLGPVTLAVAGLEAEGQLACNERKAAYDSGARIVRIKDPVRFCGNARHEHAFTAGIKDILSAERIVIMGLTGPEADDRANYYLSKAHAAKDAMETLNVPAAAVRTHKDANFVFYLDEKTAGWGAGRGFYDKSDGLFHKMDIVGINEREVEALKIDHKSGAIKVWVRADMPPEKIDVQIWTNIPEGENLANEWHSIGMSYVGTERDGAYRFEARLIPAKEGSFAYTVRIAPKKRPLRVEWPGEWIWWKGGDKRFKVTANGNDKDKAPAVYLRLPAPAGFYRDIDAKVDGVISETCKPMEKNASTVVPDNDIGWNGVNAIIRKCGLRTFEEGSRPVLHVVDIRGRNGAPLLGFRLEEGAESIEDLVPVVSYVSENDGKVHIFMTSAFYDDYLDVSHMNSSINRRRLRLLRLAELLDHEIFENSPEAGEVSPENRHHEAALRARHFVRGQQGISPFHKWAIDSLASTAGGRDHLMVLLDEYRQEEEGREQKRYEDNFYKYAKNVLPRKRYSRETQRQAHHVFRVYHNGDVEAFGRLCREAGIADPDALNLKIEKVAERHIMNAMEGFSPDITITETSETTVEIDSSKGIVRKSLKGPYARFFWDVLYKDENGPMIISGLFNLIAEEGFDLIDDKKYEPAVLYIHGLMKKNMDPETLTGLSKERAVKNLFDDYVTTQLPILGSYLKAKDRLGGLIADFAIVGGKIYQKKAMPVTVYLQHLIECTGPFSHLSDRSFENKNRIARDILEKYLDCIEEITWRGAVVLNAKLTNFGVNDSGEVVLIDLGVSSLEWLAETKRDARTKFFITQMKLVADARRLEDLNGELNLGETGVTRDFSDKEEAARLQRRWARIWAELLSGIKRGDDEELDLDPRRSGWEIERELEAIFPKDLEVAKKEHRRITFIPTEMAEEEMLQVIMDEIAAARDAESKAAERREAAEKLARDFGDGAGRVKEFIGAGKGALDHYESRVFNVFYDYWEIKRVTRAHFAVCSGKPVTFYSKTIEGRGPRVIDPYVKELEEENRVTTAAHEAGVAPASIFIMNGGEPMLVQLEAEGIPLQKSGTEKDKAVIQASGIALRKMHDAGIIHRDLVWRDQISEKTRLKGEHIYLKSDSSGEKISFIDFGIHEAYLDARSPDHKAKTRLNYTEVLLGMYDFFEGGLSPVEIEEAFRKGYERGGQTLGEGAYTADVRSGTARAMLDEIMLRLLPAASCNGKVIIGIGTEWMPDKQGAQAVVAAITRLAKKKGFEDLVFVREKGENLAAALLKEAKNSGTPLSQVIAIGGEAAIRSEAFNELRSTESLRKALLIGVDAKGLNEESFLDIPEMLTYAVKLAFGDIDSVDSENLTAIRAGPRMWIFIPKARPMSFEERKTFYDCQLRTLTAA